MNPLKWNLAFADMDQVQIECSCTIGHRARHGGAHRAHRVGAVTPRATARLLAPLLSSSPISAQIVATRTDRLGVCARGRAGDLQWARGEDLYLLATYSSTQSLLLRH